MTPPLATADPGLLEHEGLAPAVPGGRRHGHGAGPPAGRDRRTARRAWAAAVVAAVAWSTARVLLAGDGVVNDGGWVLVRRFLAAAVRPELSAEFLGVAWDATLTTLSYAVLGTALSVAAGLVLGVVSSETWWRGRSGAGDRSGRRRAGGWLAARGALSLPRGVHEAVWALFLVRVLGLDPLVGVLAIALPYGAVTAKVYGELLDEAPGRAYAAVRAAGVGRLKALAYTLLPQALPDMVSYAFYRFECSIRAAAILGIVGAGGLGFELALSFQSLRYAEMWTLVYALVLVSGLADWWSTALRRRLRSAAPAGGGAPAGEAGRPRRGRFLSGSGAAATALVVGAAWHLGPDVATLWAERARRLLADVAASSWPPDLGRSSAATLARLSLETVEMALVATAVAAVAGAVVAVVAAGRLPHRGARAAAVAARAALLACRAVPPPVWALLFLFVLFPGPLPGALALAAYNFGILGRLMAEVVENLDDGPGRVLAAAGAPSSAVLLYATLPAALPRFVAYAVYRWEVTLRETVVVGLVGAGGLGRLLSAQLSAFDYRGAAATLLALVLLTFAADLVGGAVRRSLR